MSKKRRKQSILLDVSEIATRGYPFSISWPHQLVFKEHREGEVVRQVSINITPTMLCEIASVLYKAREDILLSAKSIDSSLGPKP